MLLFLDIDGVLHPHIGYRQELCFINLPLIEGVLHIFPEVDVVISSTWRTTRTLEELRSLFSREIHSRIIGVTPHWKDFQDAAAYGCYTRQAEIQMWLQLAGRSWEKWIAIDDQASLFRPFCKNLILTNSKTGLTKEDCVVLERKFKG